METISGIRIDKPSPDRVIVPAGEVVQARLAVIDIPTIAQQGPRVAAMVPSVDRAHPRGHRV